MFVGAGTESIKEITLSVISDDYEEIELISAEVEEFCAQHGIGVNRQAVVRSLGELIVEGFALAYVYRDDKQRFEVAEFAPEHVSDLWFYATPKGISLVEARNETVGPAETPSGS